MTTRHAADGQPEQQRELEAVPVKVLNGKLTKFWSSSFNMMGGISGLMAIALVIWRGGALEKMVQVDSARMDRWEQMGTPSLRQHERMDDERVEDLRRRMLLVEAAMQQAVDLKVEIRVIGTKLDAINDRLKSMEQVSSKAIKP